MPYIPGQTVRFRAEFRDQNNALVNPATVTVTLEAPNGTESNPTPINDGVGLYHFDIVVSQGGYYRHHWEGRSGAFEAVADGYVYVAFV